MGEGVGAVLLGGGGFFLWRRCSEKTSEKDEDRTFVLN